jgi:SAM-dependent methyltransferase
VTEFTGERVVPGQVNDELWAEHVARYAFATRFADVGRTLDIGCGTGYGAADLAQQSDLVIGVDIASDALAYAQEHYPLANTRFLPASATALPFSGGSFHLVTAFEVLEHLTDWRALLQETRRVLLPQGVFLVSTPNKFYYAESRADTGPNPFHEHEFEFHEFRDALEAFFPYVDILLQNRLEAFAFYPHSRFSPVETRLDGTRGSPQEAHFFVAVCAFDRPPEVRTFVYVPRASNLLREREQHIEALQSQFARMTAERDELIRLHEELHHQLEDHNRWALNLEAEWKAAQQRIVQLQEEFQKEQAAAAAVVAGLENENFIKTSWARDTEKRLQEAVRLLDAAETSVIERTQWAQKLQAQLNAAESQLNLLRESRWVKLGRSVGLGPELEVNRRAKDGD